MSDLKKQIAKRKRFDHAFAVVGFLSVVVGLATLGALFYTLIRDGSNQMLVYKGTNDIVTGKTKSPDNKELHPGEQTDEIRKLSGDALLDLKAAGLTGKSLDRESATLMVQWIKLDEIVDLPKLKAAAADPDKLADMPRKKKMGAFIRADRLKDLQSKGQLHQIVTGNAFLAGDRERTLADQNAYKPLLNVAAIEAMIKSDSLPDLFSRRGVEDASAGYRDVKANVTAWLEQGTFEANVYKLMDLQKLAHFINSDALLALAEKEHAIARARPRELNTPFLTHLGPSKSPELTGLLVAWVGSFALIFVTMLIALPLGIGAGIYLEEYARKNKLTALIEINIANLAGVPSIIYGLMFLGFFIYILKMDRSLGAAGMTLGLLVLPIVIMATREAIRAIPQNIREASYACGATKWQTVRYHIFPYSSGGILTGSIIGLSRAIGETAPLVVIGAAAFITSLPPSPIKAQLFFLDFAWFKSSFTAMPLQIYNLTSKPQAGHEYYASFNHAAALGSLILIVLTLALNGIAIYMRYKLRKRIKW